MESLELEAISKRLQETVRESSPETGILLTERESQRTVTAVNKICSIITSHLSEGDLRNQRSSSEGCLLSPRVHQQERRLSQHSLGQITEISTSCQVAFSSSTMESEEIMHELTEEQDRELTSMEQEVYYNQYLAEHKSQLALWNQMTDFRREYSEMKNQIESLLTRLQMDLSTMSREASCKFVLFLSQLGCSTCTTGEGLQSCYERLKSLQSEVDKTQMENSALLTKLDALLQTKSALQDQVEARENAIQSLTDTVDQLQSHCHQLEESSADSNQLHDLMLTLENSLKAIGHLIIEDADDAVPVLVENPVHENFPESPFLSLTILAERTCSAVKAALLRRKTELQEYKVKIGELEKIMVSNTQEKDNSEHHNGSLQNELNSLRTQLGEALKEKQQLVEAAQEREEMVTSIKKELESTQQGIQKLSSELHSEKTLREDLERALEELRNEEVLQRSSHSELVAEFQQINCDNQLCRMHISTLEERVDKLRLELAAAAEEKAKLAGGLDFAKDEKAELNSKLQELSSKIEQLKDQMNTLQLEKLSAEESLSRLQYLKSLDESQLAKLTSMTEELENERLLLRKDHEELDEEVTALKHELVKAEELRSRLEYYSTSLENNLQTAIKENEELREQLEKSFESSEQILDRFNSLERRTCEVEAENLRLTEEAARLGKELSHFKELKQIWQEEEENYQSKIKAAEDDHRRVYDQLTAAENNLQITNVSLLAIQAELEQTQQAGQQLREELQQLLSEKEYLLMQYEALQKSSDAAIGRLQAENKEHAQNLAVLQEKLKSVMEDKNNNMASYTKEKDDLKMSFQVEIQRKEEFYSKQTEELRLKQQQETQDLKKDFQAQLAKLQDDLVKLDLEKHEKAAAAQQERQNLQEKWQATYAELEAERAEVTRLRHEEVERQLENRLAAEGFRSEIARLQSEMRNLAESRNKDQQSSSQILQATQETLKKTETNLTEVKNDLVAANRELKEMQRQLEATQIQLNKAEMQREEFRRESSLLRQQLEESRAENASSSQAYSSLEGSLKRLEADKLDLLKCLEEARKRIADLEESRTALEHDVVELRSNLRDVEQQAGKLTSDLSSTEQKRARYYDQLQRLQERCEVLMEQVHAEQSRAILAEKAAEESESRLTALKLQYQKLQLHFDSKLQRNENNTHQRLEETNLTLQQLLLKAKKSERERALTESQLVDAQSEMTILKDRLRDAESQARRLRDELDRMELQKRDSSTKLSSLLSTLHSFVAVMKEPSRHQVSASPSFLNRFHENDVSTSNINVQDVQAILNDFMRCVLQNQHRRVDVPVHDEPVKLEVRSGSQSRTDRRRRIDFTDLTSHQGLRSGLEASLNAVASHGALGVTTLQRETQRLDRLASNWPSSPSLLSPGQPVLESTPVKEN